MLLGFVGERRRLLLCSCCCCRFLRSRREFSVPLVHHAVPVRQELQLALFHGRAHSHTSVSPLSLSFTHTHEGGNRVCECSSRMQVSSINTQRHTRSHADQAATQARASYLLLVSRLPLVDGAEARAHERERAGDDHEPWQHLVRHDVPSPFAWSKMGGASPPQSALATIVPENHHLRFGV